MESIEDAEDRGVIYERALIAARTHRHWRTVDRPRFGE
jgi:hypothetical protein